LLTGEAKVSKQWSLWKAPLPPAADWKQPPIEQPASLHQPEHLSQQREKKPPKGPVVAGAPVTTPQL
jgi:hypothetical protein